MEKMVAGYVRVSTEMQIEKDSLTNQEETISNFAKSRDKEVRIYKDAGISAKDKDRPAFQKMLEDIKAGMIETLVVTKLDRITRSIKDLIYLKELFEEYGVSFVSITQNLDTSTPMGRFGFYLLGSVAQLEREMTAERVSGDMKQRAKRGKWNGGVVPFGFTSQLRHYREWLKKKAEEKTIDSGQSLREIIRSLEKDDKIRGDALAFAREMMPEQKVLAIDPKEADMVRSIYHLYLKYKSFRGVVHCLNSLGIKTREGQSWASTSIRRILQNPVYYGVLTYNKRKGVGKTSKPRPRDEHILVEGGCPAIIPGDQWEQVQEIIDGQRRIPSSSKHSQYLLTGLLECQFCRTKMYGYTYNGHRNGKAYQYYRCNGHLSKGSAFCPGNTVDAKFIEGIILEELKKLSTQPEALIERAKDFQMRFDQEVKPILDQQKAIQQSVTKIEKRKQQLLRLFEDELIEKGEFARERASLDSEKKLLEKELEDVNQKIYSNDLSNFDIQAALSSIHNLAEVFEELDLNERKELLRTVLNKIVVGKHHLDCQIFALPNSFVNWDCTHTDSLRQPA